MTTLLNNGGGTLVEFGLLPAKESKYTDDITDNLQNMRADEGPNHTTEYEPQPEFTYDISIKLLLTYYWFCWQIRQFAL